MTIALPPEDASHVVEPGTLPTPFTAAEIRDGNPAGTELRVRADAGAAGVVTRRIRYLSCDAEGAEQEFVVLDPDGEPVGEARVEHSAWTELQSHAVFPSGTTTVGAETIDTALGRLECLRYDLAADQDGDAQTFWFSPAHPGMPVVYESTHSGTRVLRVEVISLGPRHDG